MVYFVIVGTRDNPLYELDLGSSKGGDDTTKEIRHLQQFVAHSSLDVIEDQQFLSTSMYLKNIDKFNDWSVSAFITPMNTKFILLHENKNDDGIKNFMNEVHDVYLKVLLNPFFEFHLPITSPIFDSRIRALAKRYL